VEIKPRSGAIQPVRIEEAAQRVIALVRAG